MRADALAPKDGGIVRLFYSEGEQYMYKYDLIEDDEGYILQAKKFK